MLVIWAKRGAGESTISAKWKVTPPSALRAMVLGQNGHATVICHLEFLGLKLRGFVVALRC